MNQATMLSHTEQEVMMTQLAQSRGRLLALAPEGKLDSARVSQLANTEMSLTLQLHPMPLDPSEHVRAAHAFARPYLERFPQQDPMRMVVADETHNYTPRKILRRVLDHALDHLNQIEQWLVWQQQGTVPTPTDGWATSSETFQEDLLPVSQAELQAWLWRIAVTVELVAQRARSLNADQLDWIPPDGGWALRQALHHLATGEVYYVIWLDEALPDEPMARYREANRRFEHQLRRVFARPLEEQGVLFSTEHTTTTAEHLAQLVLAAEQTLLNG